ncbi:hypothetical protein B7P43_G12571 [Cryptotermes secundus]|uniref:Ionotropic glutamate receptor L-glutamate and glycine-binding domain-containing protein n=1 Tax=Cryptotermes secundus TaxID=105785 RepID=A0A2J7PZ52_9NEOP|nr:hypothetical protein B7P43_G12571 [Cryptotermes secundus]
MMPEHVRKWLRQQSKDFYAAGFDALLSGSARLRDAKWLLFLERDSCFEKFFAGIDIPFDCELVVAQPGSSHEFVLTEVYRVSPSLPLQTRRLGNCADGRAVSWPSQYLYGRRNKLQGLVLKTGVAEHLSSVIIKEKNNKPLEVGGQYGDIWRVLEQQIDFRTDYYKSRDDNFGVKLGNGSWTGMMGLVVRGEVHVSSSAFMYNAPRMEAVDYLGPMSTDRMVVYVRKPGSTVLVWNSFLLHFSPGVWMSLTVCLLLLSAASMLLDRTRIHNRKQGTREGLLLEFSRSLFSAITPFCLQGSNLARAEVSWRITHLTMYLAAIIMLASYSASLVSHIMTRTDKLPFNTFEEFLEVGTYTLGVGRHSGHYTHFEISHDPVLRAVYDKHMAPYKSALPSTGLEALNLVCVRPNYAAIELKDALPYYSNKVVCNLQEVPNACVEFKGSMIIQKKSPYLGIFRRT